MLEFQLKKMIFKKAYEGAWSEEIFTIVKCIPRNPPVYELHDLNDNPIVGTFYSFEIQKVKLKDDVFIVEKILRKKTSRGKTKFFVKWLGYDDSFNSWVDDLIQ